MFSYLLEQPKTIKQSEPKHVNMYGLLPMDWFNNLYSNISDKIKYVYVAIAKSNVFTPIVSISNCVDGGNYKRNTLAVSA